MRSPRWAWVAVLVVAGCSGAGGSDGGTGGSSGVGGGSASGGGGALAAGGGTAASFDGGQWSTPESLDDQTADTSVPALAGPFAGWVQGEAGQPNLDLRASRFEVGAAAWGAAQRVSSGASAVLADQLSLTAGADGGAIAVWAEVPVGQPQSVVTVVASVYDSASGAWSSPAVLGGDVTSATLFAAAGPRVALAPGGSALAIWEQTDGQSALARNVWASWYLPGSGWAKAAAITSEGSVTSANRQLAFDAHGGAVLVYEVQPAAGSRALEALRWDPLAKTWSSPVVLKAVVGTLSSAPQLAVDAAGDALVVWGEGATAALAYAARFDAAAGSWGAAQRLEGASDGGTSGSVRVATGADGNGWGLWAHQDVGGTELWTRRISGGVWAEPQPLTSVRGAGVTDVALGVEPVSGVGTVIFMQDTQLPGSLELSYLAHACRSAPSSGWTEPNLLEGTEGLSNGPSVSASAGVTIAVWTHSPLLTGDAHVWGSVVR